MNHILLTQGLIFYLRNQKFIIYTLFRNGSDLHTYNYFRGNFAASW